jgi:bacterioferritin
MLRDPKVIELLNRHLTNELTAINQYFLHARILDNWGVTKLGRKEYAESIEEMQHADKLIERILFLGGLPNVQRLNPVLIGQSVREVLECDQKLEEKALADLREGIEYCEKVRDYVSRDLFLKILADEEEHADFIDTQFELIERIGIERYTLLNSDAAPDMKGKDADGRRPARRRPDRGAGATFRICHCEAFAFATSLPSEARAKPGPEGRASMPQPRLRLATGCREAR